MSKTRFGFLLGTAFVMTVLGSVGGIFLYKTFFETKDVVYVKNELPATFSRYTDDAPTREPATNPQTLPDFIGAASVARPAVVHIRSRYEANRKQQNSDFFSNPFRDFFNDDMFEVPEGVATGSGVLISPDGYIATNNHVISEASSVEVTLFDNRNFSAKVIGTDISTDLALLKIEAEDLPNLTFGNSDEVQVGQWVLAVGNPMDLTSTVTAGIVSAKGRNINLLRADSEFAIESFIQTDAAVNKGNSGGALVDANGNLIGINTAIASRTGYYAGYSFAIPATIARKVMEDLLAFGEVRRGFLGVSIQPVNADLAAREGLSVLKGAFVAGLTPELGAAEAGIREGDVIISVNGVEVNSSSELQEQVSRFRPGDKVKVVAYRGSEMKNFIVTLKILERREIAHNGREPDPEVEAENAAPVEYKGSTFRSLNGEELRKLNLEYGVMVDEVGESLEEGGIRDGFRRYRN
jgi:serine protease Do